MQVSVENVGKLERRLTVSVPSAKLESAVSARLGELARTARLKGFRPGKVPRRVIEQRYGSQVRGEAMSELIGDSFNQAVREQSLRPAAAPSIETVSDPAEGEIRFVATFEVVPEFGTIDVGDLELTRTVSRVEDGDVEAMIQTLREQRRSWKPVDRPAAAGDLVLIESHTEVDGERRPAEGSERGATVIGSGAMLPEVESALVGMTAGGEKQVEVTYPAGWRVAELAGRDARVCLRVTRISEPQLPEVDAEFIASFGIADGDLEHFRREVRANLERELRAALMARLREEVADKLFARYGDTDLPHSMIEAEARELARRTQEQARQQGQKDVTVAPEAFQGAARRRVLVGLVLSELARQRQLRLDPRRVEEALANIASTYEEPEQVVALYRQDQRLMGGLRARVLEEQVMDWIAEHARVTEQELSFAEVMKAARAR